MKIKKVICYVKENGIKKSFKKAKSVLLKGKCYASMNEDYQKWIKKNDVFVALVTLFQWAHSS